MSLVKFFSRFTREFARCAFLLLFSLQLIVPTWAQAPAWWATRGVLNPTASADDYAAVNQGQVKHIAKQAYDEMASVLPDGAGATLDGMWASPVPSTDDYAAINVGQLKNVAKPFYDRLHEAGYTGQPLTAGQIYPWSGVTSSDDYALANIGQVKNLFSFDLSTITIVDNVNMLVVDGNQQVGPSGGVLPVPLTVVVTTAEGLPLSGQTVTFSAQGGGLLSTSIGSVGLNSQQVTTDLLGRAFIYLRVNGAAGAVNPVVASLTSYSLTFIEYVSWAVASSPGSGEVPSPLSPAVPSPGGEVSGNPEAWAGITEYGFLSGISLNINPYDPYGVESPRLYWGAASGAGITYFLERRENYGPWQVIYSGGELAYVDSGLFSGVFYQYRIYYKGGGRVSAPVVCAYSVEPVKWMRKQSYYAPEGPGEWVPVGWEKRNSILIGYGSGEIRWAVDFSQRKGEFVPYVYHEIMDFSEWDYYGKYLVQEGAISAPGGTVQRPAFDTAQLHSLGGSYGNYSWSGSIQAKTSFYSISYGQRTVHWSAFYEAGVRLSLGDSVEVLNINEAYSMGVASPVADLKFTVNWDDDEIEVRKYDGFYDAVGNVVESGVEVSIGQRIKIHRLVADVRGREIEFLLTPSDPDFQIYGSNLKVVLSDEFVGGANIPLSESSGAKYRKIALNGAPLTDEKPQQEAESGQSKEETFIDSLTLGLRHDTTDTYMSVPSADLFLGARRSVATDIWNIRRGLRPHERPDRPFGTGWTSNLAAGIQFTRMLGSSMDSVENPDTATVTDENGASHSFAILYPENAAYDPTTGYAGQMTFVPLPTSKHEQSTHLTSLVKDGASYVFKRKFGSTLTYDMSALAVSLPSDRIDGSSSGQENKWARLTTVVDRYGNTLDYTYSSFYTLIPATIKVRRTDGLGAMLSIRQNEEGLITDVWDAAGYKVSYAYTSVGDTHQLTSVTTSDGKVTTYDYSITTEADQSPNSVDPHHEPKLHFNLTGITDPLNRTYVFDYLHDHSKQDYSTEAYYTKTGLPMQVSKVTLPNGNFSEFENESSVKLVRNTTTDKLEFEGVRRNRVIDAEGNLRVYDFTNTQVEEMEDFASIYHKQEKFDVPRMIYYRTMEITSYQKTGSIQEELGSESFTFDPASGMSLSSATDFSGNVTTYAYDDVFSNTLFTQAGAGSTLYGRYSDPTSQTNALSKTKTFTYGANRIMTSSTDEAGVKTEWEVDTVGRRLKETITDDSETVVQETTFHYKDTVGAHLDGAVNYANVSTNFLTKKVVKKLSGVDEPSWVQDLVTAYVPDANSRVAKEIIDPSGLALTTEYTYDANGNKLTSKDPRNNVTTFSYDKRNRLTHVTYADSHQKRFFYDDRGNKVREEDENDVATLWEYDALNRVTHQAIDMNGNGLIDRLGDGITPNRAVDLVTSYTYDKLNAKVTTTNPKGTVTMFEYDALQRLVKKTDDFGTGRLNYVTTYEYDTAKNTGGSAFDSSGFKPTKVTDPRNYRTEVTYDALYRPVEEKVEYATGVYATTVKTYDDVGNLLTTTDPLGTVTKTTYDALRRPVTITEAFGTTLDATGSNAYTSTGLAWKSVDALENETTTEYDAAGRAVKVFAPAVADALNGGTDTTPITETIYDAASNVVAVINPLRVRTDYTYDNRNRRQTEQLPAVVDATNPDAPAVRPTRVTAYDGVSNVIAVQDARGFITTTEYDNARRPVEVTSPPVTKVDGSVVNPTMVNTYDPVGNVLTITDANGHVTTNTYDPLNRLLTTTQSPTIDPADNITVTNEYDAAGNRTAVIDGKSQRTEFTYDGLSRNTSVKDPANRSVSFEFNALNKTARVDSESQRTEYGYDARHRLTAVTYVGRTQDNRAYAYDDLSRILSVTEAGKSGKADVGYTYDALGRQLTETSGGKTHAYAYDLAGNRITVTYGGTGTVLASTYDVLNRLETLTENARVTTYGYDLNGNRVYQKLPNGEDVDTQYDPLNRPVAITTSKSNGSLLLQLTQVHDQVGNLMKLTERHYGSSLTPRTVTNSYDNVNRLISEVNVEGVKTIATTYGFDKANNRTAKAVATTTGSGTDVVDTAYAYNSLNQLLTATEGATVTTFTYDLNGNRETREKGGNTDTYAYDYDNRLVSLDKDTTGGTGTYAYMYDYRTRRVERTEDSTTTQVVFSGGVSVAEYVASIATVEYVRGSDWGGGVGGLLYSVRSGVPSFKHYNSRGDVISETNASGVATWQGTYEAFGTRTQESGSTADRQKANTKEEDPTGLLNEGFRYRCLETGAFITRDPLGFVDGPNMYAYVAQNPWSKFDALGLFWDPDSGWWGASEYKTFGKAMFVDPTVDSFNAGSQHMADGFQQIADGNVIEGGLNVVAAVGKAAEVTLDVATVGRGSSVKKQAVNVVEAGVDLAKGGRVTLSKLAGKVDNAAKLNNAAKKGSKVSETAADVSQKAKKETGSYTNHHASGKTYDGKGDKKRSQTSAKRVEAETGDQHVATEWTPAANNKEALKQESRRLDSHGGAKSDTNHNKIESPGKKLREQDGD